MPGNAAESPGLTPLTDGIATKGSVVIADKAYDSNDLRAEWQGRGVTVVIPPRANRVEAIAYDSEMYKWHHLVETFFCQLKHVRHLARRFEKTNVSDAAMIHVVSSRLVLA